MHPLLLLLFEYQIRKGIITQGSLAWNTWLKLGVHLWCKLSISLLNLWLRGTRVATEDGSQICQNCVWRLWHRSLLLSLSDNWLRNGCLIKPRPLICLGCCHRCRIFFKSSPWSPIWFRFRCWLHLLYRITRWLYFDRLCIEFKEVNSCGLSYRCRLLNHIGPLLPRWSHQLPQSFSLTNCLLFLLNWVTLRPRLLLLVTLLLFLLLLFLLLLLVLIRIFTIAAHFLILREPLLLILQVEELLHLSRVSAVGFGVHRRFVARHQRFIGIL